MKPSNITLLYMPKSTKPSKIKVNHGALLSLVHCT